MDKYEIAKEITITALNNHYVIGTIDPVNSSFEEKNEAVAKNVAAFYNTLIENLKVEK